ncbi:hypothetical protein L211DRAFT_853660 [Terfezia boudieri ATCC MYA-4762]|uniref:Uncharacterized protein n=1 Tax=Terfezia boudieri ATCC MYA-4762 TaxID=1051890 RepID=A0A3N4LAY1_9PEZI|nr:hypothetical protein L211DRAFT_853660 [Terfezia boudieri ATCC MYA-4762]
MTVPSFSESSVTEIPLEICCLLLTPTPSTAKAVLSNDDCKSLTGLVGSRLIEGPYPKGLKDDRKSITGLDIDELFRLEKDELFRIERDELFRLEKDELFRFERDELFRLEKDEFYKLDKDEHFRLDKKGVSASIRNREESGALQARQKIVSSSATKGIVSSTGSE